MKNGMLSGSICPVATQDIKTNLKNRNHAFKVYGYGPPNPDDENYAFWLRKAKMYKSTPALVKNMRCGNCAAFIQTPKMLECIKSGLEKANASEKELSYDQQFIDVANLGFCELFHFTCAGGRTCDAWKSGGPITKE